MKRFFALLTVLLLSGGFLLSAFAAYRGVGLVTSGSETTRSVYVPIFSGGGPNSGK